MLFRWRTKTSLECNVLVFFFVFSFVREYLMRHHVIVSFCVAMLQRVVFAKKSCNPTARLQWCPLQSMCAKGLHDSGFNQNFMLGSTIFTNDPIVNHIFIMGFLPPDRTCELTGEQKSLCCNSPVYQPVASLRHFFCCGFHSKKTLRSSLFV